MKIETMPDFRKSLLDADEHLDIKINRFGGSTTPAIMWKAFFLHCTWWHKIWSPSSRYVQNNVMIEVSLHHLMVNYMQVVFLQQH